MIDMCFQGIYFIVFYVIYVNVIIMNKIYVFVMWGIFFLFVYIYFLFCILKKIFFCVVLIEFLVMVGNKKGRYLIVKCFLDLLMYLYRILCLGVVNF